MASSFSCCRFSFSRHRDDAAALRPPLQPLKSWSRTGVGFLPLAAGGKTFLSLASGAVVALDEASGREVWHFALPRAYSLKAESDGAFLLHDGNILVYFDRELITLEQASGAVVSRHPVPMLSLKGAVVDREFLLCHFETEEKAAAGAFDLRTGAPVWQQSWPWASPWLTASEGILCACAERRVFSGIDIASGKTLCQFPLDKLGQHEDELGDAQEGDLIGIPSVVGGCVIAAVLGYHAAALDLHTGRQIWTQELKTRNPFNLSYYPDGKLYELGPRYYHRIDSNTGRIEDTHDCGDEFKKAGVAGPFTDLGISDEYIYAVDFVGWLIAFHKTRHTIDWTFRSKSKVTAFAAPLVLENRLYLLDGRGNFYAFEGA